jgi:putative DNA primase/helicase
MKLRASDAKGAITYAAAFAADVNFFLDAPAGVGFRNGFFDVKTKAFTFHSPEHRLRTSLPFNYDPQTQRCSRWMRYLDEVFAGEQDGGDKVAVLQEFVGACLFGEAWRFEKVLLLIGEGANGKSVFIDTITKLFPDNQIAATKPQSLGHPYDRAALSGVKLNAVSEIPEADILASDSFKEIVGGKLVDARSPYGAVFRFRPTAGHLFSANRLPGVLDHSHAFFRRLTVVPYNHRFNEGQRDEYLAQKLITGELPGIAAWAIAGGLRLLAAQRYTEPASSKAALEAWKVESDAVALFLAECTEPDPDGPGTPTRVVYATMRRWFDDSGYKNMNIQTATRRLRGAGAVLFATAAGNHYRVRLLVTPPLDWSQTH